LIDCAVQCQSADDNEDDVDDDVEVFNDCDEEVPVVRLIPQTYMTRPPTNTEPFPSDTATSRAQPPTTADGKCYCRSPTTLNLSSIIEVCSTREWKIEGHSIPSHCWKYRR